VSRIALLEPSTLVGREILEAWSREVPGRAEPDLLTQRGDGVGVLTRVGDAAGVVQEAGSLDGIDLLVCSDLRDGEAAILDRLPATAGAIILPAATATIEAPAHVAGINPAARGARVQSAHPAVVGATQVLTPLRELGLSGAQVTALLPVSVHSATALDELLEQTRAVLSFSAVKSVASFPAQLVYNALPSVSPPGEAARQLRDTLGDLPVAAHFLQAGIFHAVSLSLHCQLAATATAEDVRQALGAESVIELDDDPSSLGPIRAAGSTAVLVGEVVPSGVPGGFWIWAVLDNLTRGGALNALGLARTMLGG